MGAPTACYREASPEFKRFVKVQDLTHLYQLAQEKKSITLVGGPKGWVGHQGRQPAAWAINWTGQTLYWLLPHMYVYEPKEKKYGKRNHVCR